MADEEVGSFPAGAFHRAGSGGSVWLQPPRVGGGAKHRPSKYRTDLQGCLKVRHPPFPRATAGETGCAARRQECGPWAGRASSFPSTRPLRLVEVTLSLFALPTLGATNLPAPTSRQSALRRPVSREGRGACC